VGVIARSRCPPRVATIADRPIWRHSTRSLECAMSSTMTAWLLVLGWLPMLVRLPRRDARLAAEPGRSMSRHPSRASSLDRALWAATWIVGAALTVCAVLDVRRTTQPLRFGAGVALFLTGMALWSWGRAVQGEQFAQMIRAPRALVTRGPYRICRHP